MTGEVSSALRWGILGTGGIAARFAGELGQQVVAVGSRSRAGAEEFGEAHSIKRRHRSYPDLVEDPEVDVVYVATPHPFHAEHALLAIRARKPVLIEKPFAMNAGEARVIVDAARVAGVFAMEAMWTRFLPHMVRLRELLADGAIGAVQTLSADQGMWFQPDPRHRLFAAELGGGALLDLGIYPFSFASMVLGPPQTVRASSVPTGTGVDQTTSAVLTYQGGAHAVLTCTCAASTPTRAWIAGTEGRIEIDNPWYSATSLSLVRRASGRRQDGEVQRYESPPGTAREGAKGMRFEAAEVARCLAAGLLESPVMPLDETISIMGTLDEVRDQSRPVRAS